MDFFFFCRVENILRKGEMFSKCSFPRVVINLYCLNLYHTIWTFNDIGKEGAFKKNMEGKGENAFLPFSTVFSTLLNKFCHFSYMYIVVCKSFEFGPA